MGGLIANNDRYQATNGLYRKYQEKGEVSAIWLLSFTRSYSVID